MRVDVYEKHKSPPLVATRGGFLWLLLLTGLSRLAVGGFEMRAVPEPVAIVADDFRPATRLERTVLHDGRLAEEQVLKEVVRTELLVGSPDGMTFGEAEHDAGLTQLDRFRGRGETKHLVAEKLEEVIARGDLGVPLVDPEADTAGVVLVHQIDRTTIELGVAHHRLVAGVGDTENVRRQIAGSAALTRRCPDDSRRPPDERVDDPLERHDRVASDHGPHDHRCWLAGSTVDAELPLGRADDPLDLVVGSDGVGLVQRIVVLDDDAMHLGLRLHRGAEGAHEHETCDQETGSLHLTSPRSRS